MVKQWIDKRLYLFYSGVLLLYLVNVFMDVLFVEYIVGILAIPMIIISILGASRLFKILGSAFIASGTIMYISANIPFYEIPLFLTSNMSLLAFLTVLPWINSAVHVGRYDQRINELMEENVESLGSLYVRSTLTTYTLMTFLNLSAINLSQGVLLKNMANLKKTIRDSFISRTTIRAFCLALIWSPMEIIVAITVDATGVSYLAYLPWLFFISILTLTLDILWSRKRYQSVAYEPANVTNKVYSRKKIYTQIFKLLIALFLFLTIIIVVSNLFNLNFILTVTLVIIPFSSIWALLMRKGYYFRVLGWRVWKEQTNHMQNFVVLFLSLAFFSNSLKETALLNLIQQPFLAFEAYPIVILVLILCTYILLAMIGVHPIATIGVLVEILTPLFAVLNPVSIGIVLIVSSLATAGSGTYGIAVTMTSMNTNQNPYRITLNNLPFTLFFGFIGILIAYLII